MCGEQGNYTQYDGPNITPALEAELMRDVIIIAGVNIVRSRPWPTLEPRAILHTRYSTCATNVLLSSMGESAGRRYHSLLRSGVLSGTLRFAAVSRDRRRTQVVRSSWMSGTADNPAYDPAQTCHVMTTTHIAGRSGERVSVAFISRCWQFSWSMQRCTWFRTCARCTNSAGTATWSIGLG